MRYTERSRMLSSIGAVRVEMDERFDRDVRGYRERNAAVGRNTWNESKASFANEELSADERLSRVHGERDGEDWMKDAKCKEQRIFPLFTAARVR